MSIKSGKARLAIQVKVVDQKVMGAIKCDINVGLSFDNSYQRARSFMDEAETQEN